MNSVTCTVAVPPSTSTADRPTGVKLRQAVAAALWGSVPMSDEQGEQTAKPRAGGQQMQDLRYDQSGAEAAAERAGMAKHRLECERHRRQDRGDGIPRTPRPEQGQCRQQQHAAHQQPLPELCPQRHHRQGLKRHRDAAGAGNDRTLHRYPCNADDQRERRADAGDTQQPPPQARGIFGCFGHGGGRHKREEHQRAEQRHQRRHVRAAQQCHHDFQSAHALITGHCH